MTPDELAAIRERDAGGFQRTGAERDRRALLAHIDALEKHRKECLSRLQEWTARATRAETHIDALEKAVEGLPNPIMDGLTRAPAPSSPQGRMLQGFEMGRAAVLALLRGER